MASPLLSYDAQSVLATWVAEQLRDRSSGRLEIVAAQEREGPGFDRELRLRLPDGVEHRGLEALLHALSFTPEDGRALRTFTRSPLRRRLYRAGYRWASTNRESALWLAERRWGPGRTAYSVSSWLFLRLLALVFFIAFTSLGVQVRGLFGEQGIVPLGSLLARAAQGADWRLLVRAPTLLWFGASDGVLVGLCVLGALLSVVLAVGFAQRGVLVALFLLYLSFVSVGTPFLAFQWDTMLLETAFLAFFLAPPALWSPRPSASPPLLPRWLLKWLLFRVMFLSGVVKLTSGDESWRHFTALEFHLWTQPLPSSAAAWVAHHAGAALRGETALTLVIECLLPFLVFGHRPMRRIAVLGMLALLGGIALTGSFGFLGLLTGALCLLVLDDHDWRWLRLRITPAVEHRSSALRSAWGGLQTLVLLWVFVATLGSGWARVRRSWELPALLRLTQGTTAPLMIANAYGMFEVMTKDRLEIALEGSSDGQTWQRYGFRYKPGDPLRAPRYAAPHMPRLDWMMWFAALGECSESPWLFALQQRLLEGSVTVGALFENGPPERPRYLRTVVERYRFAPSDSDAFWKAEPQGAYCPAVTLESGRLVRAPL